MFFSLLLVTYVLATHEPGDCFNQPSILNAVDNKRNVASDKDMLNRLKRDHTVVEVGGCFDKDKVYSLYTVWGLVDSKTGAISDRVTSTMHAHEKKDKNLAIADAATYNCDAKMTFDKGESVKFVKIFKGSR